MVCLRGLGALSSFSRSLVSGAGARNLINMMFKSCQLIASMPLHRLIPGEKGSFSPVCHKMVLTLSLYLEI